MAFLRSIVPGPQLEARTHNVPYNQLEDGGPRTCAKDDRRKSLRRSATASATANAASIIVIAIAFRNLSEMHINHTVILEDPLSFYLWL